MSTDNYDPDRLGGSGGEDLSFLADVRAALQERAAVPRRVVEAGYAAFSWRSIDAELAELLYDSATAEFAASGARSDQATVRAMTFASEQATIELELSAEAVFGQIVPTLRGEIVVVVDGELGQRVPVDEVGGFRITAVPATTFRLRFEGAGITVVTGPITV